MSAAVVGLPSKKSEPCSLPVNVEGADPDVHPQSRIRRRDLVDREPSLRDVVEMAAVLDFRATTCGQRYRRSQNRPGAFRVGLMLWLLTPKPCVLTLALALAVARTKPVTRSCLEASLGELIR